MTWVQDETEDGYEVVAPSGGTFQVVSQEEVRFFNDIAARYQQDNHFQNVTDLLDLDRLLVMEVMSWRWGRWLSQEHDYDGQAVDLDTLKKAQGEFSKEIRLLKKAMGLEKAQRDREKGESIPEYLENLRRRAKEFGVMREQQLTRALTLFQELRALTTLYLNCDEEERREQNIEMSDLVEWIVKIAIPEFEEVDAYFTANSQKFWLRSL